MKIGVDYYPEQWDRALWEQDADRMQHIGVKIVRIAEFAWSRLEPEEGKYDFAWLDEAIRLFAVRGIQVILGTPTCTPPLWLFEKYPEVIQVDRNGNRIPIGIRGHRCLNSPVYRRLSAGIIRRMAGRYAQEPAVVGYQIDNELEAFHCCCPVCQEGFRQWMKEKYGTIERVNEAYGNSVWSGEYSSFSQVTPPMGEHPQWLNPSLSLDFNRYASHSAVDYVRFQAKLIRELAPEAQITTNNWLCENMPDFYDLFRELDIVSYDNYPAVTLPEDTECLYSHAFHLDLMRGIRKQNFWIMEQLSGGLGSWSPMSPTPRPGMIKGYSLQAIAHGADAVLHFRWRTGISGAEMYWHGLIDHSNVPGRRLEEFQDLCREAQELEGLQGSVIKNQIAILYSSLQEYAFKIQYQAEGMHYFTQLKAYHDAFTSLGVGVDIVDWRSDLEEYKIVVAPTILIVDQKITDHLHAFVKRGGHLILTNRSGVKDIYNKCLMQPLPSVFADMAGAVVKEYDPIGTARQKVDLTEEHWKGFRKSLQDTPSFCTLWCDILDAGDARVLARYGEGFYAGEAAAVENPYGQGTAYYIGTVFDRRTMCSLGRYVAEKAGIHCMEQLPLGVERTVRQKEDRQWVFYFNNTEQAQNFFLDSEDCSGECMGRPILPGEQISLKPFEMKILVK